jgi:hypothetical protein
MGVIGRCLVAGFALLAIGCGSRQIQLGNAWQLPEPSGPEDALIIGHVIIGEKAQPLTPEVVRIFRKDKVYAGMLGEAHHVFSDGRFVARVKPGTFHFNSFFANDTNFQVATNPKAVEWFTVKPGQVYYLGSFHAKLTESERFWKPGEFSIERTKNPTKRELLQWLKTISKGTGWEARVRKHAG